MFLTIGLSLQLLEFVCLLKSRLEFSGESIINLSIFLNPLNCPIFILSSSVTAGGFC